MPAEHGGKLATATLGALSDLDSMWAEVDAVRAKQRPAIARPPGCFTLTEYVERYGIPATTAQRELARMVKAGKIEEIRVMTPDKLGRLCARVAYQPAAKAAA